MIKGTVKGQSLVLTYPTTVSDTVGYLTAEFTFLGGDWAGLSKWAHFKKGDEAYVIRLDDGKIPATEHLNLSAGEWEVYLHGTAAVDGEVFRRITTVSRMMVVTACGVLDGEPLPIAPPSVGEQILATAEQALSIAESVREETAQKEQELEMVLDEIIEMQEQLLGGLEQ